MDDFLEQTAVRQKRGIFTLLYYLIFALTVVFALLALFGLSSMIGVNPETGGINFRLPMLICFPQSGHSQTLRGVPQ